MRRVSLAWTLARSGVLSAETAQDPGYLAEPGGGRGRLNGWIVDYRSHACFARRG